MRMRTPLIKMALGLIAAILLGLGGLNLYQQHRAPNVTFTTLSGQKIAMADLKGKLVLVNFWSTNCLSCLQEMPGLVQLYQRYHALGFELVAVAMAYDPPSQVLHYTNQKKLPFPVMHDGYGEMSAAFGDVGVTPSHFIFNKQGQRLQRTMGSLDLTALGQLLDRELAQPH